MTLLYPNLCYKGTTLYSEGNIKDFRNKVNEGVPER